MKRYPKSFIIGVISFSLFYLFFIVLFTYRLPDKVLVLVGDINQIDGDIELDTNASEFYSVYVISMEKPTLFQYMIANLDYRISIETLPESYQDLNMQDSYISNQILEELSYEYAIIQAYTLAHQINPLIDITYDLRGYVVSFVDAKQTALKLNDIIISIDNIDAGDVSNSEFKALFSVNDMVNMKVDRDGTLVDVVMTRLESGFFGISIDPIYNINTNPTLTYHYNEDMIGGPSGGLIQTLSIYADLLDLDMQDLVISGTGTIEFDGSIGEIGGIKQKIYTVSNKPIDIFFCPSDNYAEALAVYNTLNNPSFILVKVGDIDEAIQALYQALSN